VANNQRIMNNLRVAQEHDDASHEAEIARQRATVVAAAEVEAVAAPKAEVVEEMELSSWSTIRGAEGGAEADGVEHDDRGEDGGAEAAEGERQKPSRSGKRLRPFGRKGRGGRGGRGGCRHLIHSVATEDKEAAATGAVAGAEGKEEEVSEEETLLCKQKLEHKGGRVWCNQPIDHVGPHDPPPQSKRRAVGAQTRLGDEDEGPQWQSAKGTRRAHTTPIEAPARAPIHDAAVVSAPEPTSSEASAAEQQPAHPRANLMVRLYEVSSLLGIDTSALLTAPAIVAACFEKLGERPPDDGLWVRLERLEEALG